DTRAADTTVARPAVESAPTSPAVAEPPVRGGARVEGQAPVKGQAPVRVGLAPDPWQEGLFESAQVTEDFRLRHRERLLVWLIPAVVTAAVGSWGIGRPSLWTDELATAGM